jgi:multiple sugar transport system permease protein/sn-glycerol 3-phosphate transport system permease protein
MMNTFYMATLVSIGTVTISVAAAYAFTRWQFPGKNLLFWLFIGTLLIPPQIIIIPNYLLLARLGWLNTLSGLTIPQLAGGFGVFYLRQQFRAFPKELFDAGTIDGANALRLLWNILLPNMRPALATLAILIFVQTWNEYFWPLMVTRNLSSTVVQVGIQIFLNPASTDWGALMAAATISLLPVLVLYIFTQRYVKNAFLHSGMNV